MLALALVVVAARSWDVCAVVRTAPLQRVQLPALLISLLAAAGNERGTKVLCIVVDTENHERSLDYIDRAVAMTNTLATDGFFLALNHRMPGFVASKTMFGYDATQRVLEMLLARPNQSTLDESMCRYFLFTNGDNLYSRYLFNELHDAMTARVDLIAYDFISHHIGHRLHAVAFKFADIDLGSAVVSHAALAKTNATFFREPDRNYRAHSSDWTLFEKLLAKQDVTRTIVRKVLFLHM